MPLINYFESGIVPYLYKWSTKNIELLWYGTDTTHNFTKHPNKTIWEHVKVSYKFNEHGFRTYEFEDYYNKNVNIALGCSQTLGVGMPVNSIWPSLIEQSTNLPMLNFGIAGASTDTIARALTNISHLFKINNVYILWPEYARFELYCSEEILPIIAGHSKIEHVWNLETVQSYNRFKHNQIITKLLSEKYNFNIFESSVNEQHPQIDDARDSAHFGFETHKNIAQILLTQKE